MVFLRAGFVSGSGNRIATLIVSYCVGDGEGERSELQLRLLQGLLEPQAQVSLGFSVGCNQMGTFFCGDVVLDRFNMVSKDKDIILNQIFVKKHSATRNS